MYATNGRSMAEEDDHDLVQHEPSWGDDEAMDTRPSRRAMGWRAVLEAVSPSKNFSQTWDSPTGQEVDDWTPSLYNYNQVC